MDPDSPRERSARSERPTVAARALLALAVPTWGAAMIQSLQGTVNALWIGRLLGPDALAASHNANIIIFLLSSLTFGFGTAGMVAVARARGSGDLAEMRRCFATALVVLSGVAITLALGAALGAHALLVAMGTAPKVLPLAEQYLRAVLISTPAAFVLLFVMMALRGSGDATTSLPYMAVLLVGDAGLNPILIKGFAAAPGLGIAGSGVATAISTYVALVALVIVLHARRHPLSLGRAEMKRLLVPPPHILRPILVQGGPNSVQMTLTALAAMMMTTLVNGHGASATAAYGAVTQVWIYLQMPGNAVATAVAARAAQNLGASDRHAADQVAWLGLLMAITVTTSLVLLALLSSAPLLSALLPEAPKAIFEARKANALASWMFIPAAATAVLSARMRASGQVWPPLLISLVALYPVRGGLAAWLTPRLGVDAVWWSLAGGACVALVLTVACRAVLFGFGVTRTRTRRGPLMADRGPS